MAPKILIVDDMPDAIEFLPDWLQREGYTTRMATRGQQALALAEESRPDLILLDVMMPGMDGIETCRRLRMNPATANIPVILVSARSPSEARAEGLLAGATDYITKPIHFPDLLERVERLVHLKEDMPPDHRRLLEEMAYTALAVLPCNLAWLLIVDNDSRWLISQSIAVDRGADAARHFLSLIQGEQPEISFPLVHGDNPLAEVALNRRVLINIPAAKFSDLTGGLLFRDAFAQFHFEYISLLPLVTSGRAVGVMVLATMDARVAESQRAQQILNSLSNQAATVVDNARLMADLAAREGQMRAEQEFRQMVLDTMGEGLVVVDDEAKITYVNNRLLLLTGFNREALYGRSVGLIFHPNNREQVVSSLTGQRRSTLSFSQQLFTQNGSVVPVLLSRATAPSPDGRGRSTVMVVTDLSELHRNEEALKLQTLRLESINRAATAISSASSLQDVMQISLQSALDVVQGVSASILLLDPDTEGVLSVVAALGPHTDQLGLRRIAPGEGVAGWVASAARPQLVDDVNSNDSVAAEYGDSYGGEISSLLVVPLIAFDEVIGVLEVVNKTDGFFDDLDLEILGSLAGSAAITIENARLFDQTRRRVTELSTLLDASAAVTSTLDFGDILERIARRLSLALQVERVVITDWHRQSNRLTTLAEVVNAYWPSNAGPVRRLKEMPVTRQIFETGAMQIVSKNAPDDALPPVELNASGLRLAAAFPIKMPQGVVGVIALYGETSPDGLPGGRSEAVSDIVNRWRDDIRAYDASDWLSRPNLTDLCQRVLQASGMRWCSVFHWDRGRNTVRVLREIGYALWLDKSGQVWEVGQFPRLTQVLEAGEAQTLQIAELQDDPNEQAYLRRIGGTTCLVAPLVIRGESSGVVKLIDSRREGRIFDAAELSLCRGIANVVGNAMENAQLYTAQEQRATALEAAYRELQEADQIKDELLQNLSHELRTPLTHILGYLRLMVDRAFGSLTAEQVETLELVARKAQHLADLVNDIVSVQESEARNLMPRPIHLERVVALAVRSLAGAAQARNVTIVPRVPANLPLAYADPVRVGEVFEELLENAIKFSPPSTQIELTIDDPGGLMLHASVRDHGIGIPAGEHEKIFRRFYQVDSGTTRRYGGTGLGLTIVRQVVEGHNGRLWVESEPGQGSCFHLTLPKAAATADTE